MSDTDASGSTDGGEPVAATSERGHAPPGEVGDEAGDEVRDEVLRVEGLTKRFGGLVACDDATFGVERGTITGLIGPNGAGKSTLFNLVAGVYRPDAGSVVVNGTDVTGMAPHQVAEHGLVRTFQTPRKLEGMTVREAMLVGPQNQPGERLHKLFTAPDEVGAAEARHLEAVEEILEEFEIDHLATQPATGISGGQMKLVELARAMLAEPEVLLLDEPVAGVNPTLTKDLEAQIRRLHEAGTTFLIIEHDMDFIMNLADPIVVLHQGTVLTEGSPADVRADERVVDAYLGGGA